MKKKNQESLQLKNLIRTFESLKLLQETNDWEASIVLGQHVAHQLVDIVNQFSKKGKFQKTVIEATILEKTPNLKKSSAAWKSLAQQANQSKNALDLSAIKKETDQLGRDILIISRQIQFLETDPEKTNQWLARKFKSLKKKGVLVLFGVLFLAFFLLTIFSLKKEKNSLKAEYFGDTELMSLEVTKKDRMINFDWGHEAPLWGFSSDYFSVRWSGSITIPESGEYEFITVSDDGVRLWISDTKVINNWTTHSATTDRKKMHLEKGKYPIRLEYYDNTAFARIELKWKTPGSEDAEIIGPQFFSPQQ